MGVVPPDPSWGNLIEDGQKYLATQPWLMLMPGERNLPKEVKAMNVAMKKAEATVNYHGLKAGACNFKLG